MPSPTIHGVVGIDGVVPIYNPEGRWCIWGLHEIYLGQQGNNKYVPKINDYVIDHFTYTTYKVDHLDPITLIPTLREIRPANMTYSFTETDILFGVGPGTQADTYRVYVDKSVTPHTLCVDTRLKVAGTMSSYAKLFKGSDLSETGKVISKIYNTHGQLVTQNIPLELVAIDSHENHSIKVVKVCHTTEDLKDGEIITVVIYSDAGHVVSKRQLLVENTSFIRSLNVSTKYVSHISVESPFLSSSDNHTLEVPLNISMDSVNIMGVVNYSDGSTMKLPIDGNKFRMDGLNQHLSSITGQEVDLVLNYALGTNETAYNGVSSDGKYVTQPFKLKTINSNYSYNVKLFGYPIWISQTAGYNMKWWLYNLDRNIYLDVTSFVRFNSNTGAFNPKGYGYLQRKSVSINLRDVSLSFKPFIHTQLVDIMLYDEPQIAPTSWTMTHEAIAGRPVYGDGIVAKRINATTLNLKSGLTTLTEWKEKLYRQTYPLVDPARELSAPEPNYFVIQIDSVTREIPIADWDKNINLNYNLSLYKTVTVRFIKKTATGDLQLSIACMLLKP